MYEKRGKQCGCGHLLSSSTATTFSVSPADTSSPQLRAPKGHGPPELKFIFHFPAVGNLMKFHLMQFTCSSQALAWTLEGTGENTTALVLVCMVLTEGLALCRGCPGGDSGTASVWAEDPRTRFWEKRPSSVEGARQNFTFHSGKWGRRILGI